MRLQCAPDGQQVKRGKSECDQGDRELHPAPFRLVDEDSVDGQAKEHEAKQRIDNEPSHRTALPRPVQVPGKPVADEGAAHRNYEKTRNDDRTVLSQKRALLTGTL